MLHPRIIPCLLIHDSGLVKTVNFSNHKYVGDPLNAVKIFNEKEVDEIIVLDIDASVRNKEPDYELISALAAECRMPLCYGGGIKNVKQVERIISLGVEKVAISSAAILSPVFIQEASERVGSQSIAVAIDFKATGILQNDYHAFIHNGEKRINTNLFKFIDKIQSLGAGEIIFNSIDRDGTRKGYDSKFIDRIRKHVSVPITVLGGAGSLEDISELINHFGIIGAAAGSLFVFKGKYRAVLIQYPIFSQKPTISSSNH